MKRFLLALFLAATPLKAAVSLDAHSANQDSGGTSPLTFSYTVGAGATVLFVKAGLAESDGSAVTGVTYNGVSMTRCEFNDGEAGQDLRGYIFYLNSPPTGAHNVVVTFTGGLGLLAEAESWKGTDTSFTWPNTATNQCGSPGGGAVSCQADASAQGFPVTFLAVGLEFFSGTASPSLTSGFGTVTDFTSSIDSGVTVSIYTGEKTAASPNATMKADFDDAGIISALNVAAGAAGSGSTYSPATLSGVTVHGVTIR